jgi:hypothetical protein
MSVPERKIVENISRKRKEDILVPDLLVLLIAIYILTCDIF